ncbi:GIY-YIG nuclease family protein [Jannaschia aquimarina]|uniref:GIY-YIG nuclease superfamily protein n=1 Tax=Jannaschia aquimarina TaxID=935700 RepID=A0A0D1D8X0_9RHOB|nr:GIY-YIG nuclease family protein [Jannaschia aquimarina]KIT16323.1 GIY-YIG nuclease superfamily protein [Jannaschia aquimarina]SNT26198.1 putative endonuclease [Jannaschia aquimarina]
MWTYILASQRNGTLYVGVTSDLVRRVWEHREHVAPNSFTARCNVTKLVWFERHEAAPYAIKREKSIKKWKRAWKISLIERENPEWCDLWSGISRLS